ncbi:DUF2470 domain-containing protein [Streptomyces sp. NPDC002055]|uniref:DUF2470 domain-containing protein n=1 Tax=Streptomyces sp. NPDC002055 TaxID=3154534 RepID=UPI003327994D
MRLFTTPPGQPTSAERIRTVLTTATSMTMVTEGHRTEVSRLSGPGAAEHIHLHPLMPDDSLTPGAPTAPELAPATLEFTDISPIPVRDRVRARVTVSGWLKATEGPSPDGSHCMEFAEAALETAGVRTTVGLDELMAAAADPLATCEAGMLTHMADDHSDLVMLLMRLVDPGLVQHVLRAVPLAIDRYGITLRLEYARSHQDVRLPFPSPLTDADQAGVRIHALLNIARRCSHRGRLLHDS